MAGTAGAIKAGRAFVEFFTDTTKFAAGLNTVQMRLRKISASIALTGASISAIGTAGAVGFLPMIKAAGDFESTLALFGTVFKTNTRSMRDWSNQTSKALGRSQAELMGFAAEAASVLSNVGFNDSQVMEMSQSLTKLAVDVGSLQNISDKDSFGKLISGITGDGDALRSIGVIANDAAVNLELLASGLDPKNATEAQKVFARYSLTIQQMSEAQGDARRNAGTFTNQLKKLKSQVADLYIAIGRPLQSALASMMKRFEQTSNAIVKLVTLNPGLVSSFARLAVSVAAVGAALIGVAAAFAGAAVVVRTIVAPFMAISAVVGLLVPLLSALLSPIGLVIAAIAALGTTFVDYIGGLQPFFNWFRAQFDEVVTVARQAITGIMAALERGDFAAAIEVALSGVDVPLTTAIGSMKIAWSGFTSYFKEAFAKAAYALPVIMLGVSAQLQKGFARLQASLAGTAVANANNAAKQEANRQFDALEERLRQLRDSGSISESDFESRLSALQTARTADMSEAEKRAAQDQSNIDKQRIAEINKINAAAKTELDALKTQMDAEVSAIRGETDGAISEAQTKLEAAKKRYQGALQNAQIGGADARPETPPPENMIDLDNLRSRLAALKDGARNTEDVKQKATAGPLVGGERAGQVFGTMGLEEINREQLKTQRATLKANEKMITYLRNFSNRWMLEFQ